MNLSASDVADLNTLAHWLAEDDFNTEQVSEADLMILAGHAVLPNIAGAFALLAQTSLPLLISGGIGHSTELLRNALTASQQYGTLRFEGASEAELLAELATAAFNLSSERLLLENKSRNCGENAAFSLQMLLTLGERPQRIILVQDPLMQRRTAETYRFTWASHGVSATFISWPVFIPYLEKTDGGLRIAGAGTAEGLWSVDRFVAMTLGEIRRLRDDAEGYGPAGQGFIGHVDLPDAVHQAWQRLVDLPELARLVR